MGIGQSRTEDLPTEKDAFEEYCPSPASLSLVEGLFPDDPTETIYLGASGFSRSEISIFADDVVEFQWFSLDEPGYSIYQAVSDGNHLKPVPGGLVSGAPTVKGKWAQRFRHPATYWFIGSGLRSSPMSITVMPRDTHRILVNETGFHPETIRICKGKKIEWYWQDPITQHSVHKVLHCARHNGFMATDVGNKLATLSGTFVHEFPEPGIFYFQSAGSSPSDKFLCVVHVMDIANEHTVDVYQTNFSPMFLTIEQGDRVWWSWTGSTYAETVHAVFQVHCPEFNESAEEPLKAVGEGGFKWNTPSSAGLVSHMFEQPGVFFYTDQNYDSVASYVGVVMVLPAPKKHYFELTKEQGIRPNLACVEANDQLWWIWNQEKIDMKEQSYVMEIERCIGHGEGTTMTYNHCKDRCNLLTDAEMDVMCCIGLQMSTPPETGVYQFRLSNCGQTIESLSIVAVPQSKNHFVTVSDDGYSPRITIVESGDTVWWTWRDTQAAHNIYQVSQSGEKIIGGFGSGGLLESPAAACYTFKNPGIYYYVSQSMPVLYGVVQVHSQALISPVYVNEIALKAVKSRVGDVVAWIHQQPTCYDIREIDIVKDSMRLMDEDPVYISPRRVVARQFSSPGVYHYSSPQFGSDQLKEPHQLRSAKRKISSVIVDPVQDAVPVRVSKTGFTPTKLCIYKGGSLCWTWAGTGEMHNIVYVQSPKSSEPLRAVEDVSAFTSGGIVKDGQFVFTFPMAGEFWIASQGAPGHLFCVTVLGQKLVSDSPFISSQKIGDVVGHNEQVALKTPMEEGKIYYTLNGTRPQRSNRNCFLYDHRLQIRLSDTGFCFIRAYTTNEMCLDSEEYTSLRFEVQMKPKTPTNEKEKNALSAFDMGSVEKYNTNEVKRNWFECTPTISCYFSVPGTLIVAWVSSPFRNLVRGYQVFLNGISYSKILQASSNKVCCSGLAGGEIYSVLVTVYSGEPNFFPLNSETLTVVCPETTLQNGPLISIRICNEADAVLCTWKHSPTPKPDGAADHYLVCVNGIPHGEPVYPDPEDKDCCRIVESLQLRMLYKLFVMPIGNDGKAMEISNKIAFTLPLDVQNITYPHTSVLAQMPSKQANEYISVVEDSTENRSKTTRPMSVKIWDAVVRDRSSLYLTQSSSIKEIKLQSRRHQRLYKSCKESSIPSATSSDDGSFYKKGKRKMERVHKPSQPPQAFHTEKGKDSSIHHQHEPVHYHKRERAGFTQKDATVEEKQVQQYPHERSVAIEVDKQEFEKYLEVPERTVGGEDFHENKPSKMLLNPAGSVKRDYHGRPGTSASDHSTVDSDRSYLFEGKSNSDLSTEFEELPPNTLVIEPITAAKAPNSRSIEANITTLVNENEDTARVVLSIRHENESSVIASWFLKDEWKHPVEKTGHVLCVCGTSFYEDLIGSDMSYSSQVRRHGLILPAVEHCFHLCPETTNHQVSGLLPSTTYEFTVILQFKDEAGMQNSMRSAIVTYVTWGPPQPPVLQCTAVGEREVVVSWEPRDVHESVGINTFVVNVQPQGFVRDFPHDEREAILSNIFPGVEYHVTVKATTSRIDVGPSSLSNEITIYCPTIPPAPDFISIAPADSAHEVKIYWPHVSIPKTDYGVIGYLVFVDGELLDEIASSTSKGEQPSCIIADMDPEEVYEVSIVCRAGWSDVSPASAVQRAVCQILSDFSIICPIMCTAPPVSPRIEVENITKKEIFLAWSPAIEYRDAKVSGYQLYKDFEPQGNILSSDSTFAVVKGLQYGNEYSFQVAALTDHPVGKAADDDVTYSACEPGRLLILEYSGFIEPVSEVFAKVITGHSVVIGWSLPVVDCRHSSHPDSFMVLLRQANNNNFNIQTLYAGPNFVEAEFEDLCENTGYTVVVQGRKSLHIDGSETVIFANSTPFSFRTLSPPKGICNLVVADSSCTSMKLCWDNQPDPEGQIVNLIVEYAPYTSSMSSASIKKDLNVTTSNVVLTHLYENTDYLVTLTAVTHESLALAQSLTSSIKSCSWMPSINVVASTCGTTAAKDLVVIVRECNHLTLQWTKPETKGSNKILRQIVRWTEWFSYGTVGPLQFANKLSLGRDDFQASLSHLISGQLYRISIEVVVEAKIHLDCSNVPGNRFNEIVVSSDPLFVSTPPDLPEFDLLLTQYDKNTAHFQWDYPVTWCATENCTNVNQIEACYQQWTVNEFKMYKDGTSIRHVNRGKTNVALNTSQVRNAEIVVKALVSRHGIDKECENVNQEYVCSKLVKTTDLGHDKFLAVKAEVKKEIGTDAHTVTLSWNYDGDKARLSHFVVTWHTNDTRTSTTTSSKRVPAKSFGTEILITNSGCIAHFQIMDIQVDRPHPSSKSQVVAVFLPCKLPSPKLWLQKMEIDSFTIEWGAPKTLCVPIDSFRIFVNDVDINQEILSSHRSFKITSEPNLMYAVQIQAISGSELYESSALSEKLEIFTGRVIETFFAGSKPSDTTVVDNHIPVRATEQPKSSCISLAWPKLPLPIQKQLMNYRVIWSSNCDPQKHEEIVRIQKSRFKLNKIVQGDTYFFKVLLIGKDNRVVHSSKEIQITASATPDPPVVRLKASNLQYILLEWEKSKEYGSMIVVSYTILKDGLVLTQIPANKYEYLDNSGKSCKQYVYQVGASTGTEGYDSALSDPLIVTWPGVVPPTLIHVPTPVSDEIRIEWEKPTTSGGVSVSSYLAQCNENAEPLERAIYKTSIGPLHSDSTSAVFENLPNSATGFTVKLLVYILGVADAFESEPLVIFPGSAPNPPKVAVAVLGQTERRNLENVIGSMCRRRDMLLQSIHVEAHDCQYGMCDLSTNFEMYQLSDTLYRIEQLLAESLEQIEDYSRHMKLGVSWSDPIPVERAQVAKFRLFVDGERIGSDYSSDVRNTTMQLSVDKPQYSIGIRSIRELPEISSILSNTVIVKTASFRPLTYFCLHQVHRPVSGKADTGCCDYKNTWSQEIHTNSSTSLCPGPLHNKRFFPSLSGISVDKCATVSLVKISYESFPSEATKTTVQLLQEKRKKAKQKVMMFWTPWCAASQKAMNLFIQLAAKTGDGIDYITCAFDPTVEGPMPQKELLSLMTERGHFRVAKIKHIIVSREVVDILSIYGVPTFIFVHPNGTMAWQGRFFIETLLDMSKFVSHVTARMQGNPCQCSDCPQCEPLLLAISNTEKQASHAQTTAMLPAIRRPLEVSPAYPPFNLNPYMYDPFLARWQYYNPHQAALRRRVPWSYYATDHDPRNRQTAIAPKKGHRPDFKELPPIRAMNATESSEQTSSSPTSPTRVPWFRPRKSALIQMARRGPSSTSHTSFELTDPSTSTSSPTFFGQTRRRGITARQILRPDN